MRRPVATFAAIAAALLCAAPGWAGGRNGTPSPRPLWQTYPLNPAHRGHAKPALSGTYRLTIPDRPAAAPDPRDLARIQPSSGSAWLTTALALAALALVAGFAGFAVWRWRPFGRSPSLFSVWRERIVGGGRDWAVYVVGRRLSAAGGSLAGARRRFRTRLRRAHRVRPPAAVSPTEPETVHDEPLAEPPAPADPLAAIREQLARARREHVALSLLLVEADDPVNVERKIAEAAGVDGDAITGGGVSGGWLLLRGVVPRRACRLAEAALASAAADGHLAVGIAGYPRHAQSTEALFRMSRRALERAAASGRGIVVASDDWVEQAEDDSAAAPSGTAARRSYAKRKRRASRH